MPFYFDRTWNQIGDLSAQKMSDTARFLDREIVRLERSVGTLDAYDVWIGCFERAGGAVCGTAHGFEGLTTPESTPSSAPVPESNESSCIIL